MTKGFRQAPAEKNKERLRAIETELKNSQMSQRITQMLLKQMMDSLQNMQQDLGRSLNLINELQYKLLAVQTVSGLDVSKLGEITNNLRLKDFNEASDNEDKQGNFTVGELVQEDSTIIITSTTDNSDKGIFRSRIKLSECGVPDLINGFMGRDVGAKISTKLNGEEHMIELLGIRNPPVAEVVEQSSDVLAAPAPAAEVVQEQQVH